MPGRRLREWRYSSTVLDHGTRWRRVVSFTIRPLHSDEGAPSTHWLGGWVGSRASLDAMEKRKISCPMPGTEPQPSKLVDCRYTDCAIPAPTATLRILLRVWVTFDGVLDWILDLLPTYTLTTRDYTLQIIITHRLVSLVYYSLR
jgi:hypothetical protein